MRATRAQAHFCYRRRIEVKSRFIVQAYNYPRTYSSLLRKIKEYVIHFPLTFDLKRIERAQWKTVNSSHELLRF